MCSVLKIGLASLCLVTVVGCGSESKPPKQVQNDRHAEEIESIPQESAPRQTPQIANSDSTQDVADLSPSPVPRAVVVVMRSTPKETFMTYTSALSGRDWKAEFVCLNEQSQLRALSSAFYLANEKFVFDPPPFAKKHPVDWGLCLGASSSGTAHMSSALEKVEDLPLFYGELMGWLETLYPSASSGGPFYKSKDWQHAEFVEDDSGDDTATVYAKGPSFDRTKIERKAYILEKKDGNWLVDLSKSEEASLKYQQAAVNVSVEQLHSFDFDADVYQVAFASDSSWFAIGSERELSVRDVQTGEKVWSVDTKDASIASLAISHDDKIIAVGLGWVSREDGFTIRLYDAKSGAEKESFGKHTKNAGFIAFGARDRELVTGGEEGAIHIWNVAEASKLRSLIFGAQGFANSFSIAPDKKRIATRVPTESIDVWDLDSGEKIVEIGGRHIEHFEFAPNGRHIVANHRDELSSPQILTKWDSKSGMQVSTRELKGIRFVYSMAISPNGERLATGVEDWEIKLWDLATGQESATLTGHKNIVRFLRFSPGGTRLASVGVDRTVKLWGVKSAK